ncbi:PHD finger protein MALE STERILITY 1-like [Hibiscus syriacus]|uniref:PHD finger protein MALE STERILITY 1-like n=1 Tax=Hibiscus syriacus TaxID=106335 RepID=A0A6A2XDH2_HIBSY|nr:PHD finger protein MALE STERILITY 1-like [Hibiscus syriacus]
MRDHLVLYVDRLVRPVPLQPVELEAAPSPDASCSAKEKEIVRGGDEEEPLIQAAECLICQEEDSNNNLETPCACSGRLKYAHRKCVQHWCNEKGDIICEICHQPYQPGYTASPCDQTEETAIDIGGVWTISGSPLDLGDPRLLAIADAERQLLEAEYDEYAASNASGAAFCRSAVLILPTYLHLNRNLRQWPLLPVFLTVERITYTIILSLLPTLMSEGEPPRFCPGLQAAQLKIFITFFWFLYLGLMALLLVRHALTVPDADTEDDVSTFFSVFLLRAAGFLLPCYIMAWAVSILKRQRQRQEAAALAATQIAFVLQSGQRRGVHFTITSGPTVTTHQESA